MTSSVADDASTPPPRSWSHRLGLDRFSGLYLLAVFFVFFGLTEDNFLQWNGSIEFVLTQKVIVCMLALAFLVPMTTDTPSTSISFRTARTAASGLVWPSLGTGLQPEIAKTRSSN